MRNWANPVFEGSLEEACASVAHKPFVERIGLEVEGVDERVGERFVLTPKFDLGLTPWSGEMLHCSSLSFDASWRVVRIAKGYPGAMICGTYPDDFPANVR